MRNFIKTQNIRPTIFNLKFPNTTLTRSLNLKKEEKIKKFRSVVSFIVATLTLKMKIGLANRGFTERL